MDSKLKTLAETFLKTGLATSESEAYDKAREAVKAEEIIKKSGTFEEQSLEQLYGKEDIAEPIPIKPVLKATVGSRVIDEDDEEAYDHIPKSEEE